MTTASHRIDRIVFELALEGHNGARAMQERISAFCRVRMPAVLREALIDFDADARDLLIDRIELDLGAITATTSDNALAHTLAQSLGAHLRGAAAELRDDLAAGAQLASVHAWFADGERQQVAPDILIADALRADPAALARALRRWGVRQQSRARLAQSLSEPVRQALLRLLAGGDAGVIGDYLGDLDKAHRARPLVPDSAKGFACAMWEFVWTYLLVERGSRFNTRSFIAGHLQRLAARYRVNYLALLHHLGRYAATLAIAQPQRHGLVRLLADLEREAQANTGTHQSGAAAAPDAQRLHQLQAFLQFGAMPAAGAGAAPAAIVATLIEHCPDELIQLLRQLGANDSARARLLGVLDGPATEALVCLLEPADGARIVAHAAAVRRLQASKHVVSAAATPFAAAVWEFVLHYLLAEHGSFFNTRSFVKDLLHKLATRYGVRYDTLLLDLLAAARPAGVVVGAALPALLLSLADETLLGISPAPLADAENAAAPALFGQWLAAGVLPGDGARHRSPGALALALSAGAPQSLGELIRACGARGTARMAATFGDDVLHRIVLALAPQQGDAVADCIALAQRAARRSALPGLDARAVRVLAWQAMLGFLLTASPACDLADLVAALAAQIERRQRFGTPVVAAFLRAGEDGSAATRGLAMSGALAALEAAGPQAPLAGVARAPGAAADSEGAGAIALMCLLVHGVRPGALPADGVAGWLAAQDDAILADVLRQYGTREAVLRRIAHDFGDVFRQRVLALVASAERGAITAFVRAALAANTRLGLDTASAFAGQLAYCTLAFLMRGAMAPPLAPSLVVTVLRALSARYGTTWRVLATELMAHGALGEGVTAGLADALERDTRARSDTTPGTVAPLAPADLALAYLASGTMPSWATPGQRAALLASIAQGTLFDPAGRFVAGLCALSHKADAARRLVRHMPLASLRRLLAALAPAYAGLAESILLVAARAGAVVMPDRAGQQRFVAWHWEQLVELLMDARGSDWQAQRLVGELASRAAVELTLPRALYLASMKDAAAHQALAQQRFAPLLDLLEQHLAAPAAVHVVERAHAGAAANASVMAEAACADPCAALSYFIRYGAVPGALHAAEGADAAVALLDAALASNAALTRRMLAAAVTHDLERARMAHVLTPAHLEALLLPVLGANYAPAVVCLAAFEAAHAALGGKAGHARAILVDLLLRVLHPQPGPAFSLTSYASAAAHLCHGNADAILSGASASLAAAAGAAPERARAALTAARHARQTVAIASRRASPGLTVPAPALPAAPQAWRGQESPAPVPPGVAFHVPNAGLVLLWQFFHPYFSALGMLSGSAFCSPEHQGRALYLMQYLVSGTLEAPEHALLLNKLLCGLDPAAPLVPCAPLTEEERAFSKQLIGTVTQHWSAMKNTSVELLRATFLMREATLVRDDKQWTLTVAPGPYDMLLQTLPWSVSTIRLSWMEDIVWVKWK